MNVAEQRENQIYGAGYPPHARSEKTLTVGRGGGHPHRNSLFRQRALSAVPLGRTRPGLSLTLSHDYGNPVVRWTQDFGQVAKIGSCS